MARTVSRLPLIERKALLEPLIADKPGQAFSSMAMRRVTAN
jgi:hypothetical protein